MKITLVTDTWAPSINGVTTTLTNIVKVLQSQGHQLQIIEPSQFKTVGAPGYPEVRLSINIWRVGPMIESFRPDAIHIATEGPLGFAARWYCKVKKRNIPHNTSYHTKFPEYLNQYYGMPLDWGYWIMRQFHKFSTRVLVTTPSMKQLLTDRGFQNLEIWSRGVDRHIFNPSSRKSNVASKPILLCVSRASIEKGLDDFCSLPTDGTKILVGDGPYLETLRNKYPNVIFAGYKHGESLAHYYANADVFVFPSRTDTFGVVMLEAMSCGTPVAAYPATGSIDVIENGVNGYVDNDINAAVQMALLCDRSQVEISSLVYSWESCADIFLKNLTKIDPKLD